MRHIDELVFHASATPVSWYRGETSQAKFNEMKRWHVEDWLWDDIGYHFLIDYDGTVIAGRPIEINGAHVRGRNDNTIGICFVGGHGGAATDKFADHFTPDQEAAALLLIEDLESQLGKTLRITGHNQFAAKACPCFDVPEWYAAAKTPIAKIDENVCPIEIENFPTWVRKFGRMIRQ